MTTDMQIDPTRADRLLGRLDEVTGDMQALFADRVERCERLSNRVRALEEAQR